ncbi:MAG: shikimate dehydrogenase [Proteobacteria bacterium]|nr:shikimate dehydrogenase [Pseudomonadota bacterium]
MSASNFAVFGHPVAHSLSPRIHAAFARQLGIAMQYTAIDATPEAFVARLDEFNAAGGKGANITLPHKHSVLAQCAEISDFARRAGAVNTLTRRLDNHWRGDNTDGAGLVRDISKRLGMDLRERRGLLLGAGGAGHAVAFALLDAGVAQLTIVNRTPARAIALADAIGEPDRVHTRDWNDLGRFGNFDLIVNATAAGHSRESLHLPFSLIAPRALCYDLSYGLAASAFVNWARAARIGYAQDGLGMLIEQAAESFAIWHGKRPNTDSVYAELRAELPLDASD